MLNAPAAIPAMIEVIFPAGFTAAEATLDVLIMTLVPISSDRHVCSAKAITGASPAHDTSRSSSNSGADWDQACDNFTESAFRNRADQGPQQSRFSQYRRHFHHSHAIQTATPSTDSG
jgi:hypothetical protein